MKMIASVLGWMAPGVGGAINPMVLLVIAVAATAVFGAGAASGWMVNGWRLGVEVEKVRADLGTMTAQAKVCGEDMRRQNNAVDAVNALGRQLAGDQLITLAAIERGAAGQRNQIGALQGLLGKPTPTRPDGSKSDCGDAWREIEARRVSR